MPKLLPNLREELLYRARVLLKEEGYTALSIRRLAQECGVALGTPYNYFKNKDELVACIMMKDWDQVRAVMEQAASEAPTIAEGVAAIFRAIRGFVGLYREIWMQFVHAGGSTDVVSKHHAVLRGQIEQSLAALANRCGAQTAEQVAPLLAETVLTAAVHDDLTEEMLCAMVAPLGRRCA